MHSPCLSQFQTPRTLNRSNGTEKKDTTLPALLPLLEELEAFQQCHGNWQFTFPSSRFFKNDPYKMRELLLIRAVQVWSEDTVTTIKALSHQLLTTNLRQLQSRFQTTQHQSQRAHRLPFCTLLSQTLSNHIFAKCHRSAQQLERISKAAKHSRSSKCMFRACTATRWGCLIQIR